MLTFILKLVGIIGASIVSYSLATTIIAGGPFLAVLLEIGAIAIIFLS